MGLVFVSHSSEDARLVEQELLPRLKARGISVWYSPEAIQSADQWERAIMRGLEASDWLLVALSPRAAKSPWVRAELNWALTNRQGRVLPVMIESVDPSQVHMLLWDLQYVDFRRPDDSAVQRIVSTVGGSAPQPRQTVEVASDRSKELEAQQEQASPLLAMALVHLQQGRNDDAIADASNGIEIAPRHAGGYFVRGLGHLAKHDADAAIADLTAALERNPTTALRAKIFEKRARAHGLKNDDRRAITDCDEALRQDATDAAALLLRAILRRRILDPDRARQDLEELVRLDPKSVEGHVQLAHVYSELKRPADSRAQYFVALALDPTVAERVPRHLKGDGPSSDRIREAMENIKPLADLARMGQLSPEAKSKVLMNLMRIGFPKMSSEVKFLLENLPRDGIEHRAVSVMADALRSIGQL